MYASVKESGVLKTMHKQDDGSYNIYIKYGDVERESNEPSLDAAVEKLEEWNERITGGV